MITKKCSKCKCIKPITDFHKNKWTKDQCQNYCKECKKAPTSKIRDLYYAKGMKRCGRCRQYKSFSEFNKCSTRHDGLDGWCKICKRNSERLRKKRSPEKYKEKDRLYRQSDQGKKTFRKYMKTDVYQRNHRIGKRRYYKKYPEKIKARSAVNNAIQSKKLMPAKVFICAICNKKNADQYHHHKGYNKNHWLDVIPVCKSCHQSEHFN